MPFEGEETFVPNLGVQPPFPLPSRSRHEPVETFGNA
jgi:hypothetical protein